MDAADHESDIELDSFKQNGTLDVEDNHAGEDEAFLEGESVATGVLSWQEKKNIVLLFSLYMIHALPMAFTWFTMPLLLRQQLNYTLIGTYYVSQYPYSVKLAWSPLIQSKFIPALGRRKTWIVPCFFLGGLVLLWLAYHQDDLVARTAAGEPGTLLWLVVAWTVLTFLCASLRVALDDWSLDLFSQANVHLVSPTSTLGEISAGFFSFNLFLGLSSLGHPNAGAKGEEISTKPYFLSIAVCFVTLSLLVLLTQRDNTHSSTPEPRRSLRNSYSIILRIIKLPQIWTLMLVHMTSMIGFETNDAITILQLVKNGFTDRDIAGLATIVLPFELLSGTLVSRFFRTHHPLQIWRTLFPYRLLAAVLSQLSVLLITKYHATPYRVWIALPPGLLSKLLDDMMFISLLSFHAQIADPAYGGIYLPLLATTLNIRYDTMGFIYTKAIGVIDGSEDLGVADPNAPLKLIDGYQIVNVVGVVLAIPVFWWFLRPATVYLQGTTRESWRIGSLEQEREDDGVKGEYEAAPMVATAEAEAEADGETEVELNEVRREGIRHRRNSENGFAHQ